MGDAGSTSDAGTDHFHLLLELAYDVSGSLDIGDVLRRSLQAIRKLVDFRGGSIQLIEEGALAIAASDPEVSPEVAALRLPLGTGLSGRVASSGTAIYSPDLDNDPRVDPEVRRLGSNQGIRSYLAVPVIAGGETVGVLQIDSEIVDAFDENHRTMVATLAPLMGSAIQNARIFAAEVDNEERTQDLDRLRNDFLTITTHELRTPLSGLIGFAELLARPDSGGILGRDDAVERILASVSKLERLVAQIDDAARAEAGTSIVEPRSGHVRDALELALERFEGRHIEVRIDPTLPSARIDVARLADAVEALLKNAANFSPPGSPITVDVGEENDVITIAVRDGGPGVAAEDARRIFEPFAQLQDPQTRSVGGLGVGLSTAKGLVEQMGGHVYVVPGPTGRFEISLLANRP